MTTLGYDDWTEDPPCYCPKDLIGSVAVCPKHSPSLIELIKREPNSEDYAFLLANVRDAVGDDDAER